MKLQSLARVALLLGVNALSGCWFMWRSDDPSVPPPSPPIFEPDVAQPTLGFTLSRGCSVLAREACPVDSRPLMTGVRERVSFSAPGSRTGQNPSVTVDDPSVVTVGAVQRASREGDRFTGLFDLTAGENRGATTLRLITADGQQWSWEVRVDAPAGMDIVDDMNEADFDRVQGRLALRVGERVGLTGVPVNLEVERLYANDGVVWAVPDVRTVNLSWSFMQGPRVVDDLAFIEGIAPGTAEITVRAGVVERTVTVTVSR